MDRKLLLVAILIYCYIISYILCLDKSRFVQLNLGSFYFTEINRNFTTKSRMGCIAECIKLNLAKRCTHAVMYNFDSGWVECSLLDATNGGIELLTADNEYEIWKNGNNFLYVYGSTGVNSTWERLSIRLAISLLTRISIFFAISAS